MRTNVYYGFEALSNGRMKAPRSALLPIHLIESESQSVEGSTVSDLGIWRVLHIIAGGTAKGAAGKRSI